MFSVRSTQIEPFRVMQLVAHARELERSGRHIVHFEVGEPDFVTAEPIRAAGARAIADGHTRYTEAVGIPELRRAIAEHYQRTTGIVLESHRIVVTSGASGALLLLSALLVNVGDRWLMTDPGYPCNRHFWTIAGGEAELVPVGADTEFQLTADLARAHWSKRVAGVLLASPANPTGAVIGRRSMTALAELAAERSAALVVDEIYQGLVYETDADALRTVLEITADAYVVQSFSKYFGMTGWRLGWIVAPEAAVEPLERLAQNLFISPSSIAQYAALAAFSTPALMEHERRREAFRLRRDLLMAGLEGLGLPVVTVPKGAFYLYVDIAATGLSAETFCWRLLNEFGVAVTPGTDFGRHQADRFVRFAYTTDERGIAEGLARVQAALGVWKRSG